LGVWIWNERAASSPQHNGSFADALGALLLMTSAAGLIGGVLIRIAITIVNRILKK
jgi:hypothetical protein